MYNKDKCKEEESYGMKTEITSTTPIGKRDNDKTSFIVLAFWLRKVHMCLTYTVKLFMTVVMIPHI